MMIKLNILNMNEFLKTVNECAGDIRIVGPDGYGQSINGQNEIQRRLISEYLENRKCLSLKLKISDPGDYFRIVSYYAGDC